MNFSYSLTENALNFPDKVAIVHGDRRATYGMFNDAVNRIASGLLDSGAVPGDRIAILLTNSLEFLEAYYACMRIGAICVPVNYRLAPEEIQYTLSHSGSSVLFTEAQFETVIDTLRGALPELKLTISISGRTDGAWVDYTGFGGEGRVVEDHPVAMDDVQRITYTSGTTAHPKAAMLTNGQVFWGALTRTTDYQLTANDVSLSVGPLYHVGALDTYATPMLFLGGTAVIHGKFEAEAVVRSIQDDGITVCWMAPSMLKMIFDTVDVSKYSTESLRMVMRGGEETTLPVLDMLERVWPNVATYDAYGLTECQGLAVTLPPSMAREKFGSVGRPCRAREMKIVDEDGNAVPPRTPGEILIRGPLVFAGYYKDPKATAATLRDGWLHTGDVGFFDEDGYLYIVDRKKDMIRSGAENIAALEVERVLFKHGAVSDVAVVAMPHEKWGEVPAAFVVRWPGKTVEPTELEAFCVERLAKYKVPKRYEFVDELPRTASGKVMKRILRQKLVEM